MTLDQEFAYLKELFRELERLWPPHSGPVSHSIAWNDEMQGLVMLFNVGNCVFSYVLEPGDISDDPVATAAHLVARGKAELQKPDADFQMIGFKR